MIQISCKSDGSNTAAGNQVKTSKSSNQNQSKIDNREVQQQISKNDNQSSGDKVKAKKMAQQRKNADNMLQDAKSSKEAAMKSGEYQKHKDELGVKGGTRSPCLYIPKSKLAKLFNWKDEDIKMKNASTKKSKYSKACFYRYNRDGDPNGGLMIQTQTNPIPGEIDDWASSFISAKITGGEKSFEPNTPAILYKKFSPEGKLGAYNAQTKKYFFKMNNDLIFMIAFNLAGNEKTQLKWANSIATDIIKGMAN